MGKDGFWGNLERLRKAIVWGGGNYGLRLGAFWAGGALIDATTRRLNGGHCGRGRHHLSRLAKTIPFRSKLGNFYLANASKLPYVALHYHTLHYKLHAHAHHYISRQCRQSLPSLYSSTLTALNVAPLMPALLARLARLTYR